MSAIAEEKSIVISSSKCTVEVNSATGAFIVIDKATGQLWSADPWQQTAGILVLQTPQGQNVELLLSKAQEITVQRLGERAVELHFERFDLPNEGSIEAAVKTRLSFTESGALRIQVLDVSYPAKWNFVELEYPCRLAMLTTDVDRGYAVIPIRQGSIVPSTMATFEEIPRVAFWAWDDGPWTDKGVHDMTVYGHVEASMPFFGAVRGQSAWIAVFETEMDAGMRCILNNNYQNVFNWKAELSPYHKLCGVSPRWLATKKQFGYARSMIYDFLPNGDYNTIAKYYKKIAVEQGLAKTLRAKIAENPNVERLFGSTIINLMGAYPWYIDYPAYRYTWNDVKKFIDDLRNFSHMQRALLCLWIGYQQYPPDSYPFHPAQGTIEELQSLVQYGLERGFMICFYHGYPALLDHDPNIDISHSHQGANGKIAARWGRHCSNFFLEHARKNLPLSLRDSQQVADYTDILTSGGLGECYGKGHEHTREEDRRNRIETLRFINSQGVFTGSEHPKGWAAAECAYFKNGGLGAYHWILDQYRTPLFHLVYKDCAVMFRELLPLPEIAMLQDVAIGCHLQYHTDMREHFQPGYMNSREGARMNSEAFQDFARETGPEELLSHEYIEELNGPFRTRFGNGAESLVNPTNEIRQVEGETLPPESILLKSENGKKRLVTAQRSWSIREL
mgnify:CR=1 FL=1